jgi:hypothetical protein
MNEIHPHLASLQEQGVMNPDRQMVNYKSMQQFRFNALRKESQDITLYTEEGDKVTISAFSRFQASYMAFDYSGSVKGKTVSLEMEKLMTSSKHAFQMTVAGDLSEEEREDIEKVLGELDTIMKDLVAGDLEGIMKRAPGIIDDAETIAGLEAVLQFEQRVSMEQRMVTQVTGEGKTLPGSGIIAKITDQLMEIIEESKVETAKLKEHMEDYFSQLLDKMALEDVKKGPMSQLVEQLREELLGLMEAV